MGGLFTKSKVKTRISESDKAVLQLKEQRDKLKMYQKRIYGTLEQEKLTAMQLVRNGHKERAKLLLRKKRYQEQLLRETDVRIERMEELVGQLEFAQIEMKVVDGLKIGNDALKKLHALASLEDVEKIMDETYEGIEKQREIDTLLGTQLSTEEEDAAQLELEMLIADSLPEAPAREPVAVGGKGDEMERRDTEVRLPGVPQEEPGLETEARKPEKEHARGARKKVALEAS